LPPLVVTVTVAVVTVAAVVAAKLNPRASHAA